MTQVKRQPQSSASSQFLNNEDSTIVVKILGPRCPSLATSVVQIYMSDATTGMKHIHLTGLFKVKICFSFLGFSFSGLDLVFKSGFQTWDSLHTSIPVLTYFSAITDCYSLVFYKNQQSNPGFELFSHLCKSLCFL